MGFKSGEVVRLMSEPGDYKVIRKKQSGFYVVLDDHGFEHVVPGSDVVKIHEEDIPLSAPYAHIVNQKEKIEKVYTSKSKSSKKIDTPIIDLHIEELLEFHNNMTNSDILQHQMMAFRGFYKSKRAEGYNKIIAIHGVGEGVLRMEIIHFLHSQENVEYHDADYRNFGGGATEIVFG
jgi:hypothetical protein